MACEGHSCAAPFWSCTGTRKFAGPRDGDGQCPRAGGAEAEPAGVHRDKPLSRRSIDMVQLVSRPIPATPWRYRFDAVLGGHPLDEDVVAALAEMQAETAYLRVFGSYRADLEDEGAKTVAA